MASHGLLGLTGIVGHDGDMSGLTGIVGHVGIDRGCRTHPHQEFRCVFHQFVMLGHCLTHCGQKEQTLGVLGRMRLNRLHIHHLYGQRPHLLSIDNCRLRHNLMHETVVIVHDTTKLPTIALQIAYVLGKVL